MTVNPKATALLSSHTLFASLNASELDLLLASAKELEYAAGDNLFSQGEEANHIYYVVSGKIKLYRIAPSGSEKVIEIINEKDTFAEALMFMEERCFPVSAEALENSVIMSIKSSVYYQILKQRSELCFDIMGSLCVRLHQRLQEIERLSLQNATDRLIHYLLTHTPEDAEDGYEHILDIPKRVLASRLSMLPETFSRVLNKLANEEIIDVHSRKISIISVKKLRDYYQFDN